MSATQNTKAQNNMGEVALRPSPIHIVTQYVRDISFENPMAPFGLKDNNPSSDMDININMDVKQIDSDQFKFLYEVVLMLSATAKQDGKTAFLAEVQYGAVVSLDGAPEDQHHPILLIEIPRLTFPFARQILSDLVSSGGYPPLLINPVDFQSMYLERFKDQLKKKN